MRTIHELLILLRDNIKPKRKFLFWKRIESGLCLEKARLENDGLINEEEYYLLSDYLRYNLPPREVNFYFCWKPKLWKPRLKWLNQQIELTK